MGFTRIAVTYGAQNDVETRGLGLTTHSNFLGVTCVIAIPFALYFIHFGRHRWIPSIALILLFGGALASGSRGAQAAAVLVAAVTVVLAPNRKSSFVQSLIGLGLAGVVVVAFAQLFLGDVLSQLVRFGSGSSDVGASDQTRTSAAQQALQDFQHFPIAGLGIKAINNAHSIYLQLLQSGGLMLLVAFLAYWIWCLRDAWVVQRLGHPIARYLFISIGVWLVLGVIENQLCDRLLYYGIGCVAALSAHYLGGGNRKGGAGEQPSIDELATAAAGLSDAGPQLHTSRR
jgi:O-antigen ligase